MEDGYEKSPAIKRGLIRLHNDELNNNRSCNRSRSHRRRHPYNHSRSRHRRHSYT